MMGRAMVFPENGEERDATERTPAGERRRALDYDQHVSHRIRQRRIMLGLTQQQLAELIGVTYQQAHKYETGINRISAGRLYQIARALGVDVNYFFEGLDSGDGPPAPRESELTPTQRLLLELARHFTAIRSRRHQEAICQLAPMLAAAEEEAEAVARDGEDLSARRGGRKRGG